MNEIRAAKPEGTKAYSLDLQLSFRKAYDKLADALRGPLLTARLVNHGSNRLLLNVEIGKNEVFIYGSHRNAGFKVTQSRDGNLGLEVGNRGEHSFKSLDEDTIFINEIEAAVRRNGIKWLVLEIFNSIRIDLERYRDLEKEFPRYKKPLSDWLAEVIPAIEQSEIKKDSGPL